MDSDFDQTARLVLMDQTERSYLAFVRAMKSEGYSNMGDLEQAWTRYCGWDGRTRPTHDIETGERRPVGGVR